MNNYAFIDGTNLHLTFAHLGWQLDYRKLRIYLTDKYSVSCAYYFVGYYAPNAYMYLVLERDGYKMMFKEIAHGDGGKIKGNCDPEIVLQAMIDLSNYDKAVIVSNDGDFACLVKYLDSCNKLDRVVAPCYAGCSHLLKQAAGVKIDFLDNAKNKIVKVVR